MHDASRVFLSQWMLKTVVCDHSNESYRVVLLCGTVYYAVQGGSKFKLLDKTPMCFNSNGSLLSCIFIQNK